ncbi:acyl-CoA dehydrogenase family protein [Streptomyces sp. NPDC048337]|uniref:acyl-CoA dehydrogenase family protein n=1 Tax=Streptomyces sp. NPDC048337 TaxID=3365535 RepID=UPI003713FF9B
MSTTDTAVAAVRSEVSSLVPTLRASGAENEERRWIAEENIKLLDDAGVFRLSVPQRFGGIDAPIAQQAEILNEIARAETATGWVSMLWVSSAWVLTFFPDRAQEEFFAGGSVRASTGFTPTGTLAPAEDGFVLNGSWKWLTGVRGADWAILAALLPGADGTPAPFAAVVPVSELTIVDDWNASSAAATGSSSVIAENVTVPAHRVVSLIEILGGTTGDRSNTGANGRNYAFIPTITTLATSSYIGIAKGAYELFLDRLPGRGITYTSWTDQKLSPVTQIQVATAANKIAAAEGLQAGQLRGLQAHADAGTLPTIEERAASRGQGAYAIQLAKEAVDILFEASGASAIQRDVPIQRYHRDITGLSLHAMFAFNTNQEVHGRAILGLAPDTPFL